jgi:hypothetical protein
VLPRDTRERQSAFRIGRSVELHNLRDAQFLGDVLHIADCAHCQAHKPLVKSEPSVMRRSGREVRVFNNALEPGQVLNSVDNILDSQSAVVLL